MLLLVSACLTWRSLETAPGETDSGDSPADSTPTETDSAPDLDADDDGVPAEEDCDDGDPELGAPTSWYTDADGDGWGDSATGVEACEGVGVPTGGDCDDDDPAISPGAAEACDGVDNDCDPGTGEAGLAAFDDGAGRQALDLSPGSAEAPTAWTVESPGTLYFCEGTWYLNLVLAADVTVVGAGLDQTTLDGAEAGSVVSVGAVTASLQGLRLRGGTAADGGGIHAEGTSLSLVDVELRQNRATGVGGGLALAGGTLSASAVDFVGNEAWRGGGLALEDEAVAVVSGSDLRSNTATFHGGGIYASDAVLSLDATEVASNVAGGAGGGAYLRGEARLDAPAAVRFTGNEAVGDGGGVAALSGATLALGSWEAEENVAGDAGGALYVYHASLTGSALTLADNRAEGCPSAELSGQSGGGGLYAEVATVWIDDAELRGNGAACSGGGAFFTGGEATLSGLRLEDNEADLYGGGLMATGGAALDLQAAALDGNRAGTGGAALGHEATLAWTDCAWTGNEADGAGGAMAVSGGSVVLSGGSFADNLAGEAGGALVVEPADSLVLDAATVDFAGDAPDELFHRAADLSYAVGSAASFWCDPLACVLE